MHHQVTTPLPLCQEDSVHDSLAITVANKVLADPSDVETTRLYCRALCLMEFTLSNKVCSYFEVQGISSVVCMGIVGV